MEDGPVPVDGLEKSRGRRDLDVIGARDIEGAVAADADIGAGSNDQRLGLRQDQVVGQRRRRRHDLGRYIFALVGIKDREALKKRDGGGLVAGLCGPLALAIRDEAVGIDDHSAAFRPS